MARVRVIACGALARELRAVLAANHLGESVDVEYLPAPLHNRPERIVPTIASRLADLPIERPVVLAYADCGTGGGLDAWIASSGREVTRLPGAHCYELFAGSEPFAAMHAAEPGTFFLTDFLARNFEALVWRGLGLDDHPELRTMLFANYRRVVLLAQTGDPAVTDAARRAAAMLELELHVEHTGLERIGTEVAVAVAGVSRQ